MIGPNGEIIGSYRKRKPLNLHHTPGTEVAIYDTIFGKVAVMICFDVENEDIFKETMAHKPFLLLNPVNIPAPSVSNEPQSILSSWKVALNSMRNKFERLASYYKFTLVRCDRPFSTADDSFGSSQCVGPYSTLLAPSYSQTYFYTFVDLTLSNQFYANPPANPRTKLEDNTGNRYTVKLFEVQNYVSKVKILTDQMFGSVCSKTKLFIWNKRTYQCVASLTTTKAVRDFIYTPINEDRKVICLQSKSIIIWDMSTNKQTTIATNLTSTADHIGNFETLLIITHKNGSLSYWTISTDGLNYEGGVQVCSERITCFKVISEKKILLCGNSSGEIYSVTPPTLQSSEVKLFLSTGQKVPLTSISVLDDKMVVGDLEGNVSLWDVSTRKRQSSFKLHQKKITDLRLVCSFLISTSLDGDMKLYDILNNNIQHVFKIHTTPVNSMDTDGEVIVSGDGFGTHMIAFEQNVFHIGLQKMLSS
eukprot:TRINITY_DN9675_c0_g1_i1.p1 TRINITY_DN9675_c0_g1~~TRINITY_DN9675_c0_g1_i1.p1  ORF type:complete len:476 (+),score=63.78 TRINITY_DN9675_c0_g1_i1:173-1600(+)